SRASVTLHRVRCTRLLKLQQQLQQFQPPGFPMRENVELLGAVGKVQGHLLGEQLGSGHQQAESAQQHHVDAAEIEEGGAENRATIFEAKQKSRQAPPRAPANLNRYYSALRDAESSAQIRWREAEPAAHFGEAPSSSLERHPACSRSHFTIISRLKIASAVAKISLECRLHDVVLLGQIAARLQNTSGMQVLMMLQMEKILGQNWLHWRGQGLYAAHCVAFSAVGRSSSLLVVLVLVVLFLLRCLGVLSQSLSESDEGGEPQLPFLSCGGAYAVKEVETMLTGAIGGILIPGLSAFVGEMEGRFAKVVHIRHRATGEESAAKLQRWRRMCGERSMKTLVDTEAAVLRLVRGHPGFVQLRACLATPQESIILMEACCGGSLQDAVGLLSESELTQPSHLAFCRLAAARLFAALAYLHQRRLCHLDVKPCNLLLRSPYSASCCDLCLCDFGLAKRLDGGPQEANRTLDGTPDYAAPEVLAYEPFSFAADLWSSGAVLFFAATGVSPFAASVSEPKQVVYSRVATVACDWSLLASHPAESLVRRLLNKSPSLRPRPRRPPVTSLRRHPLRRLRIRRLPPLKVEEAAGHSDRTTEGVLVAAVLPGAALQPAQCGQQPLPDAIDHPHDVSGTISLEHPAGQVQCQAGRGSQLKLRGVLGRVAGVQATGRRIGRHEAQPAAAILAVRPGRQSGHEPVGKLDQLHRDRPGEQPRFGRAGRQAGQSAAGRGRNWPAGPNRTAGQVQGGQHRLLCHVKSLAAIAGASALNADQPVVPVDVGLAAEQPPASLGQRSCQQVAPALGRVKAGEQAGLGRRRNGGAAFCMR
uniref:Protein kinase domain-containing protein n=1 Tax=Macrostomum lignano TaxID=282301 RepID=A0A1I8JKU4_9PLAT